MGLDQGVKSLEKLLNFSVPLSSSVKWVVIVVPLDGWED